MINEHPLENEIVRNDLGYFGNIWVRQNYLGKAGQSNVGHVHKFDHISLLTHGKVLVEIDGYPPKEFSAPTFIVIRKEHKHKFTAITDKVTWYCVFALRDYNGEVIEELFDPTQHDPTCSKACEDDYWERATNLDSKTTLHTL